MGCQSLRGGLTSAPRPRSASGRALARPSRPVSGWGQGRQPPEAVAPSASLEASRSQVYFKIQLLPGDRAFLSPSPAGKFPADLNASVEASGPHDFAVRIRAVRQRHFHVHRIPHPTSVTTAKRPSCGRETAPYRTDLVFLKIRNCVLFRWSRSHKRGASRSSRTLGAGCGGRGSVARRAILTRTAKACGPGAPTLALSFRGNNFARVTGAKEPGPRGEHV